MGQRDQEFLEELKKAFAIEAQEHLHTIVNGLLDMEKGNKEQIEDVHRALHSLKGAARAVNKDEISSICQSMEGIFLRVKKGEILLRTRDYDLLQKGADAINGFLKPQEKREDSSHLIHELNQINNPSFHDRAPLDKEIQNPPVTPETSFLKETRIEKEQIFGLDQALATDTIRVLSKKLDSLFFQVENLISIKLAGQEHLREIRSIQRFLERKIKKREGSFEERKDIQELDQKISHHYQRLFSHFQDVQRQIDDLLIDTKDILMRPFSSLSQIFPKMVRDISREQKKKVNLVVEGEETLVDKRILEGMKDPLIHLIRNAMDHGLEVKEERLAQNKPETGRILLQIKRLEGNKLMILLQDDGKGIDGEFIHQIAKMKGFISKEETYDLERSLDFIFKSGFTTKSQVTEISGQGLGMAIALDALERLGGSISVETRKKEGTTFTMILPLILATFRGILMKEGDFTFALPTLLVERVLRIKPIAIKIWGNQERITFEGASLPLVRLASILSLKGMKGIPRDYVKVLVLYSGQERIALVVEDILYEEELLLKDLGPQLRQVPFISGVSLLGNGQLVFLLNAKDLIKRVIKGDLRFQKPLKEPEEKLKKSILVAEDSITSRMLLRNILTGAGYEVEVVVNGQKAWEALKERTFDLVVSDVQMPEMDGFQLTKQIREEQRTAKVPVVLVTSLSSDEDRDRGAQVGADGYIVKSDFDQGNLLEVIHQLIS